jgi:hypothetical protein
MLESLEKVSWRSYAQPEWNCDDTVPAALRGLSACTSESASIKAYQTVLFALGNNHAGTYYPVALAALPFLSEILQGSGEWARITTLNILIDLCGSFEPESGFEMVVSPAGERSQLRVLLQQAIAHLSPQIRSIPASQTAVPRERELASELLKWIAETQHR